MTWLRSAFQDELDGVTATLVELSSIVSQAIDKATHALLTANLAEAEEVIAADDRVDNLHPTPTILQGLVGTDQLA